MIDFFKPDLTLFVILLTLLLVGFYIAQILAYLKALINIVRITHPSTDRMLGFRTGVHNTRYYFRVEFWSISYRIEFGEQNVNNDKVKTDKTFDPHSR